LYLLRPQGENQLFLPAGAIFQNSNHPYLPPVWQAERIGVEVKKSYLINPALSEVIASLGHTDSLVLADAGLPIPISTQRIDLALTRGIPSFLDTLRVVLTEMYVEKAVVAEEMLQKSPALYDDLTGILGNIPIEAIPHDDFKQATRSARAVVRTGEFTPYANVILVSGAWCFGG
jgi:D-ribose pyranase